MSGKIIDEVLLRLRTMILNGELKPDERVAEVAMAERLGVSRTPVRLALQTLEGEGLVEPKGGRGFAVKKITAFDVLCAFDVRGALEGLACRIVAENGLTRSAEATIRECIDEGDQMFKQGIPDQQIRQRWVELNEVFHQTIIDAADNLTLSATHALTCRHPLVGPGLLAYSSANMEEDISSIRKSQIEHSAIFEAIINREGARAEAIAKEHMYSARKSTSRKIATLPEDADQRAPIIAALPIDSVR